MSSEFVFSAQGDHNLQATKKPPDPKPHPSPKISFRDKLLGPSQETFIREKEDMIEKKLFRIEHENGNRLLPKVHLEPSVFQELCTPWKDAIVVKLLGKNIGYHTMRERLQKTWRPQGGFEIMDNDNGFFMVKFDEAADKEKVITGGPWLIFDHCLAVAHWTPEFASPNAKVDKTIVWVRFPGLNLVYYDESFLLAMASALGRPIKVDTNTLKIERGKFARVCVEIDLTLPVVGKIWVNGHWYKVQYEGLHLICTSCGCYGHLGRNCSVMPAKSNTTAPPHHQAAANSHGESQKTQQAGPTTIEAQLTPENNNGTAVSFSSQQSLANNGTIISNDGEHQDLHGDWLLVTRKKRIPINPTLFPSKTATAKPNRYNALNSLNAPNKNGPHKHNSQPRPLAPAQPRSILVPKETKRRRQDPDNIQEPVLDTPLTYTHKPTLATNKNETKATYGEKNIPQTANSHKAINSSNKHFSPELHIPTLDQQLNSNTTDTSSPIQVDPEVNNTKAIQSRDTEENGQDMGQDVNVIVTDNHDPHNANEEEDMVT